MPTSCCNVPLTLDPTMSDIRGNSHLWVTQHLHASDPLPIVPSTAYMWSSLWKLQPYRRDALVEKFILVGRKLVKLQLKNFLWIYKHQPIYIWNLIVEFDSEMSPGKVTSFLISYFSKGPSLGVWGWGGKGRGSEKKRGIQHTECRTLDFSPIDVSSEQ